MINDHPLLSKNNVVAQNKTAELKFPTDNDKITTTICLYNINEIFIPKSIYPPYEGAQSNLVRVRPSNEAVLNDSNIGIFFSNYLKMPMTLLIIHKALEIMLVICFF